MKNKQKGSAIIWVVITVVIIIVGVYVIGTNKKVDEQLNTNSEVVDNDSETIGDFIGYYTTYTIPDNEMFQGGTCRALKVISGHQGLIKWFSKSENDQEVEIPLNVASLSSGDKSILEKSTKENPIRITLQKEKVIGRDASACSPSVKILKITALTGQN